MSRIVSVKYGQRETEAALLTGDINVMHDANGITIEIFKGAKGYKLYIDLDDAIAKKSAFQHWRDLRR